MIPLYWKVDPHDWDNTTFGTGESMVDHVIAAVQAHTRAGSIVLSHDNRHPGTVAAYVTLLPWLSARFTLEPLPS